MKTSSAQTASADPEILGPRDGYLQLFWRFLKFGLLAWGGPVAQIDMIRHELVTELRWVSKDQFRRILAVYQVLPGPEAHELCVHFGVMAKGRLGGFLAGLGFMLPGFLLMFLLSALYLKFNFADGPFEAVFLGIQPAVIALIVRACHRIGAHSLVDRPLGLIAVLAFAAEMARVPFWITLGSAGLIYLAWKHKGLTWSASLALLCILIGWQTARGYQPFAPQATSAQSSATEKREIPARHVPVVEMAGTGLRAGLLTFGGAYTAIPFLQEDAVERGKWMSKSDFLDGIALGGVLPAPLIIFSTFVGYFGGGWLGALVMTAGVFLPAFSFSILFYRHIEAVIENPKLRHLLEGVTAGVVGIIAVTAIQLGIGVFKDWRAPIVFGAALVLVYAWKGKLAVPMLIAGAGLAGFLLYS